MSEYGPDYRLLVPVELFQEEARVIADVYNAGQRDDMAKCLFAEAFAGPAPARELVDAGAGAGAWTSTSYDNVRTFLLGLAREAHQFPTQPRRYWRERRQQPTPPPAELSLHQLQVAWSEMVVELDGRGYLDALVPSACVDGLTEQERNDDLSRRLSEEANVTIVWPPGPPEDGWPEDHFFTLVELLHDMVARPRRRHFHDYGGDWHSSDFATQPGQLLYRRKVNGLFGLSSIHLEIAGEGTDRGFLVLAPRDGRDTLVKRTIERAGTGDADPVTRAVLQFRDRTADRIQKRGACVLLANELESERDRVKQHLLSRDEGMLFQIANQFAIRHHRADQHPDYDDAYLDWIFWTYLATVELMRVLAEGH